MSRTVAVIGLAAALSLPSAAPCADRAAPLTLRVGDPSISGSSIKPFKAGYKVTQWTPKGVSKDWGTDTFELQVVMMDGRRVLKRTHFLSIPSKTVYGIAMSDQATFAPIFSEEAHSDGGYVHFEFDKAKLRSQRFGEGDTSGAFKRADLKFDRPVFDLNLGLFELMFAAAPLETGYAARFPAFVLDKRGTTWASFKVTGTESMLLPGGRRADTFVVETSYSPEWREVLWLMKEPPYVVKFAFYGARGGHEDWDLVS